MDLIHVVKKRMSHKPLTLKLEDFHLEIDAFAMLFQKSSICLCCPLILCFLRALFKGRKVIDHFYFKIWAKQVIAALLYMAWRSQNAKLSDDLESSTCSRKQNNLNVFKFAKDAKEKILLENIISLQTSYPFDYAIVELRLWRWEKSGSFSSVVRQAASATDGTYAASPPGFDLSRPEGKLLNLEPPKIMSLPWSALQRCQSQREWAASVDTCHPSMSIVGHTWRSTGQLGLLLSSVVRGGRSAPGSPSHRDSLGFVDG